MNDKKLPGLFILILTLAIGSLLELNTFESPSIGWTVFIVSADIAQLLVAIGLYFRINEVRIAAIVVLSLKLAFLVLTIGMIVIASGQINRVSPIAIATFIFHIWAIWYLLRRNVREAFSSLRASKSSASGS